MTFNDICNRLENCKLKASGKAQANCPVCGDKKQHLYITESADGKIIAHCQGAGCQGVGPNDYIKDFCSALGIKQTDLFTASTTKEQKKPEYKIDREHHYKDATGKVLATKIILKNAKGEKQARWYHIDANREKVWNRYGIKTPLYATEYLAKAQSNPDQKSKQCLFFVEGEKDADTLLKLGIYATSTPDGGNTTKWNQEWNQYVSGFQYIVVLTDNDETGKKYGNFVATNLYKSGIKPIYVIPCESIDKNLKEKGDITDIYEQVNDRQEFGLMLSDAIRNTSAFELAEETDADEDDDDIVCLADIEYKPPTFIIEPYIVQGELNMIQAEPGGGKTSFYTKLVAMVTNNGKFVGEPVPQGNVGILVSEAPEGDIQKKIELCGGNNTKVFISKAPHKYNLKNIANLERFISKRDIKLLIFDPMQDFLGQGIDMNRANETRPVLSAYQMLCRRYGCTTVFVCHTGKDSTRPLRSRFLGSTDIIGVCRSALHIDDDPNKPNTDSVEHKVVMQVKSNFGYGKPITFDIQKDYATHNVVTALTGFSTCDEVDIISNTKRKKLQCDYSTEPLIQVFRQYVAENPKGGKIDYDKLQEYAVKVTGNKYHVLQTNILKQKIASIRDELRMKDGIIVNIGATCTGNKRGISIEKYVVPTEYQTTIGELS